MQNNVVKPLTAGVTAYAVQKYYLGKDNQNAMYFGASVAGGMYVSEMISPMLKKSLGQTGGGLMEKVVELSAAGASALALNKYVLKNTNYRDNMMQDAGAIIAASVVSELFDDFINGRQLNYFSD